MLVVESITGSFESARALIFGNIIISYNIRYNRYHFYLTSSSSKKNDGK